MELHNTQHLLHPSALSICALCTLLKTELFNFLANKTRLFLKLRKAWKRLPAAYKRWTVLLDKASEMGISPRILCSEYLRRNLKGAGLQLFFILAIKTSGRV